MPCFSHEISAFSSPRSPEFRLIPGLFSLAQVNKVLVMSTNSRCVIPCISELKIDDADVNDDVKLASKWHVHKWAQ